MHDLSAVARSFKNTGIRRVAFIGNSLPRRCGIATFTTDLQQAIFQTQSGVESFIVAMKGGGRPEDYPATVGFQIADDKLEDYHLAADFINTGGFDVVCLQHEFGIFGGETGSFILALLSRLQVPVVTTLHTVLAAPNRRQREVLLRIAAASAKIIVMAEKARDLLQNVYGVSATQLEVIAHGIPDFAFVEPDRAKARLGFAGRDVILTFGLLSPNKGIEVMIDAMPRIIAARPGAVYVILGATHPNLVREQGEAYRDSLRARVAQLGIAEHVVFRDQFVDQATLIGFISMCDIYVTPYLNEAQMTSGTLAYSFGLGKAVVSTPYWHAQELLRDGKGVLVPFGDAVAAGNEITALLSNDTKRHAMRSRAYAASRSMTWARTAQRYLQVFEAAATSHGPPPHSDPVPPAMPMQHFLAMCDDTGLFQHAVYAVPDRAHGYCVDDNARALLLACALRGAAALPDGFAGRFAAFVQHAWNPATGRFRNFMGFDRQWLEETGSEDSHGRTLWALGICAQADPCEMRRRWAGDLFAAALPAVETFQSPRAWAFTLLGLAAYCETVSFSAAAGRLRRDLAGRLMAILTASRGAGWDWFEDGLAYDNARLPQALIVTGAALDRPSYVQAGLQTLRWLVARQTSKAGRFRPVGTAGFGEKHRLRGFDQQPLEATATIAACAAAMQVDGATNWHGEACRAFAWFTGANDLDLPLADEITGACRDGLHPDRRNENRGGESVVSYLLALVDMRMLALSPAPVVLASV